MGNGADFWLGNKTGSDSEFVPLAPSKTINGVKGTLIKKRGDPDDHSSLPKYANTSDMYFRQNKNGVCQGRVYVNHSMTIDFDWSHAHTNKSDGRHFPAGVVHVQVWIKQKDGSFRRLSDSARYMNNHEMKKYGPLIKYFCPDAKFR